MFSALIFPQVWNLKTFGNFSFDTLNFSFKKLFQIISNLKLQTVQNKVFKLTSVSLNNLSMHNLRLVWLLLWNKNSFILYRYLYSANDHCYVHYLYIVYINIKIYIIYNNIYIILNRNKVESSNYSRVWPWG